MSKEIDFIETLDLVEEYISLQNALGKQMAKGFMHMSEARYSMGMDRLSTAQVPARLFASIRIKEGSEALEIVSMDAAAIATAVPRDKSKQTVDIKSDFSSDTDIILTLAAKYDSDYFEKASNTNTRQSEDPIRWYGVMVPTALRSSQREFKQLLQDIVHLANIRQKILHNLTSLRHS